MDVKDLLVDSGIVASCHSSLGKELGAVMTGRPIAYRPFPHRQLIHRGRRTEKEQGKKGGKRKGELLGVRISWDMLARNSDFVLLANSAASLAAVFLWIESLRLKTIWLILRFNSSISPDASTVMSFVKSPSVAALVMSPKARTWAVKFIAMVLTSSHVSRA